MTSIPCFICYLPLKYRYLEFSTFTFAHCTRSPAYTILDQIQTQSHSSEGALSSLESSLEDRDKQINQLREQRDRAEKDSKEEKELHERELAEYKMKIHTYESEVSPVVWPRPLSPTLLVAVGRDFVFVIYSNRGFFLSKQHSMEYSNCYVGGFMHKQYVYVSASGIFIKNILLFSAKIVFSSLRKLTPLYVTVSWSRWCCCRLRSCR